MKVCFHQSLGDQQLSFQQYLFTESFSRDYSYICMNTDQNETPTVIPQHSNPKRKKKKARRIHDKRAISLKTTCLYDFPLLLSNLSVCRSLRRQKAIPCTMNQLPRESRVKPQCVSCACRGVAGRLPGLHHSFSTWKQSCRRQAWIITESSVVPMKSATFSMQHQELWDNHSMELRN